MDYNLIKFENIEWEQPVPGVRYKSFIHNDKKLRILEFSKDFVEPEWCTNGHIGYVIEGEMELTFNGEIKSYKAGDALIIPEGEENKHKHHRTIKTTKLFLVEQS